MAEFTCPAVDYADDKKDPDNYVRIDVDIKGLRKATFGKNASNAEITLDRTEQSMCLTVVPKHGSKISKYRFEVKQLPGEILVDEKKTYFKVKKDGVEIYLHKASPGSWARQLSSVGLEHHHEMN
jgi:hypothetical protein